MLRTTAGIRLPMSFRFEDDNEYENKTPRKASIYIFPQMLVRLFILKEVNPLPREK